MMDVKKAIARDERRKKARRERYASDPEFRESLLAYKRSWDKAHRDQTRAYSIKSRQKAKVIKSDSKNKTG